MAFLVSPRLALKENSEKMREVQTHSAGLREQRQDRERTSAGPAGGRYLLDDCRGKVSF